MKILLLEDEYMLSRSIQTFLLNQGYLIDCFDNGQDVLDVIGVREYDFYILDINTPLVGGLDCLEIIRKKYPMSPKIIISAYHDINYISDAYNKGCSDYLKKPFNLKELQIRIEHLTSLSKNTTSIEKSSILQLSQHYSFNKETNQLYYNKEVQQFTKREYALILLFVSNLGQIITDESIQSFVWDGEDVENSTIRSLINRVRKKLKEDLLENIRGFGYTMKRNVIV